MSLLDSMVDMAFRDEEVGRIVAPAGIVAIEATW
jgi:hypothetical protein